DDAAATAAERHWYQTALSYPSIEDDMLARLSDSVEEVEVKRALFDMTPWKAPGPDGYPAGFDQQAWEIVGSNVTDFVKNVWINPADLKRISGFRAALNLEKYLGVPLTGKAPKQIDFQYVINQLQNKLSTWKAKNLSFAGRVTLAKSVMEAIPIYPMMTTNIPVSIIKKALKLQRSFIWGDTSEGKKYHARCLMKLGWDVSRGANGLWCAVLRGKYGRGASDMMKISAKISDSSLWKNLVKLMPSIEAHYCRAIGNGQTTCAWTMPWIEPGLRIMDLAVTIPDHFSHAKVVDLIDESGCWNWDGLRWLPTSILNKLIAIPPPEEINGDDFNFWPAGKHGNFSIASAYNILAEFEHQAEAATWSIIWRINACERVRAFVWLLKHGRLLTHYRKSKMNLGPPFCMFCEDEIETELHVLRDCSKSMAVWLNTVHDSDREAFFSVDFQQWLDMNLQGNVKGIDVNNWQSYWAIACHALWTWRNKEEHNIKFVGVLLMRDGSLLTHAKKENNSSGCGGILRGSNAEWCGGFAKGLGACSVMMAELWGAWEGLRYTWRLGFRHVELHLDSKMIVDKKEGLRKGGAYARKFGDFCNPIGKFLFVIRTGRQIYVRILS
ncbi:RNA-directed DNA polymerase (Reverse transcriptase), partial [Trifolium medium]|nr:RNA-directed DNA polymerase (Reverse transcriptase) [Trifolium medium]